MESRVALLVLAVLSASCVATPSHDPEPRERAPTKGLLVGRMRAFDAEGLETDLDRLLDDVAGADAVFLGETHNDDVTHQVELEVLRGLIERTGGKVVLSMEMFERDAQPHLDRYLAGEIDEETFLRHARPWGNYRTAYRPLVELAKSAGIPVIAANAPAMLRFRVRGEKERWEALTDEERRWAPRELFPNSAAYWARVDRATRGHMGGGGEPRTPEERLWDGQSLWDNSMGEAVADAIAAHPDRVVLHVVGGFHVLGRDGTVAQTARRAPEADLRVINVWPQFDLALASGTGFNATEGDYLVYAAARASDVDQGRWSVEVGGSLRYRIRVPASASTAEPAPLLIWLGDDGARDDDGLRYWSLALGDAAAVVAVDPLHLTEEEDLRLGGRWFWSDSFTSAASRSQRGLERLLDYVTRRFPVDPERVVVAGRGTGATVVLWVAMYTNALDGVLVAADPRGTGGLRMAGLPDDKSSIAGLRVVMDDAQAEALEPLLAEYIELGLDVDEISVSAAGPMLQMEAVIRESLGIGALPKATTPARTVTLANDSATARRWAELYLRSTFAGGSPAELGAPDAVDATILDFGGLFSVADAKRLGVIPAAPGPFGGSTVLVVPAGTTDEGRRAWEAFVADDPLKKRSRFLRTVLAFEDGEPSLSEALAELLGAGRKNVLIVPARFCATGDQMRALRTAAGDVVEGMTIHWLPGLGARLATVGAAHR